jgi:hypothetical protein
MTDGLPTPRTTLRTGYVRVLVFCNSCRHQAAADLQALIDAGRGDVPLTALRFRCSQCHTARTDFVVTSRGDAIEQAGKHAKRTTREQSLLVSCLGGPLGQFATRSRPCRRASAASDRKRLVP